jgi:outer membrane receptor protein involved in Fe transport
LTVLFVAAPYVAAQDDETIDEIQVTATRRLVETDYVSAALTLVANDKVQNSKLTTDALMMEPGIFLQQTTPGQGAAIIRGLKGSEVLHLVDGFRLNNAIFRNAPTQYLALVAPGGVDRIEVVRGASASLYGSDAVGGVVQVLSRMPSFDSPGSRGTAYLGYDTADLGKIVRASYETGDERVAGLISGEYLDTGNRRIGGGERVGPSAYQSKGARIAISATPDDARSWLFDLQFARQPSTPRFDELVPGYGQTEPSSSEFLFSPNDRLFAHVRHTRKNRYAGMNRTAVTCSVLPPARRKTLIVARGSSVRSTITIASKAGALKKISSAARCRWCNRDSRMDRRSIRQPSSGTFCVTWEIATRSRAACDSARLKPIWLYRQQIRVTSVPTLAGYLMPRIKLL